MESYFVVLRHKMHKVALHTYRLKQEYGTDPLAAMAQCYSMCFKASRSVSYRILLLANSPVDVVCYKYTEISVLWSMKKEAVNTLSSEMNHVGSNVRVVF
jgi:hypothetical protein